MWWINYVNNDSNDSANTRGNSNANAATSIACIGLKQNKVCKNKYVKKDNVQQTKECYTNEL